MSDYKPPCTLTPQLLSLVANVSELVGRLSVQSESSALLRLHRVNRIKTITGSLAIEGNTLNEKQVTDILEGKRVLAPERELQEVKNAIQAYESMEKWKVASEKDLLTAHRQLTFGLIESAGKYRTSGVGVMKGDVVIHMAPQANRVPKLMYDLLSWLKKSEYHPLITSCIFHYEFEFIHPFADGNGRMGRLWQTLILKNWNTVFSHIPVESMIYKYQQDYYQAINQSTQQSDAEPFVRFMLKMIHQSLLDVAQATPQETPQVTPQVEMLLKVLKSDMSREDLQLKFKLKDRKSFRLIYLLPALDNGLIEMTLPEKPQSKMQKYRLTKLGIQMLKEKNQ